MRHTAKRVALPGLLLGALLVSTTACSPSTQQQVVNCIKEAVFTLAQNAFTDEKFSLTDGLQVGQVCVPAAIAVFNDSQPTVQPTFSLPSLGTSVQLSEDPTDYTTPVLATSEVIPNCSKTVPLSGNYYYSVPFAMIVGNDTSAMTFKDFPTSDSSDEGLIAESVYERDGLAQQTTPDTAPTPYYLPVQPIAPGTQATLQFTVTIHYRVGAARVLRNGTSGAVEVYLYDISFDPPTATQFTQQSAPLNVANC